MNECVKIGSLLQILLPLHLTISSCVVGESCIALVATKALLAGSEITYNYQYYEDGLDSLDDKMKRQKCLCGADNCSGERGRGQKEKDCMGLQD